ncbi:MAG: ACP S-malonyltransferase [Acidimicrobiia bacterium]|nr:MAG: ACP S-malonyltransferase [Acidimicrobiia bacterium]
MKTYAILFPGQGSQFVGMGADVFAARPDLLGDTADDVLDWSLSTVVSQGPDDELTRTDRAQAALYAISYALWALLAEAMPRPPSATAGHSLGEYTGLTAAGAIGFREGLALVAARGEAMAAAAALEPSTMLALMGADIAAAEEMAAGRRDAGGKLWVANINAPGQIVLAGSIEDIDWLMNNADQSGARRAIPLNVAGAFHSPYMEPAAESLARALTAADFAETGYPVYANVSARPMTDPKAQLARQLVEPVRFAESLEQMAADGIDAFIHVGPGNVTAGLARRSVPGAATYTVSAIDDIQGAVAFIE